MCKWLGWGGLLTGNIVQSDTLKNVTFYGEIFKMLEQSVSAIKLLKGNFAYKNSKEYIEYCVLASREYLFLMFDNLLCLFDPRTMSVVRYHNNEPEPAFKMKKDRICLYGFGDNYCEINYDGILLDSKFVLKE